VDSNDLAIGPATERMQPVPAVAPAQGEVAAQNQQNQPTRHPPPDESAMEASEADPNSHSDKGSDSGAAADSENEGPPHRVDSLA
jgi:hypothetical protein